MDPLILSRWQFALTTAYHFLFAPLSIGLGLFLAVTETLYVLKKDALYLRITRFWSSFFLISLIMGVVTGIVLEFQFGLNWARFSRYVGDIFGPPLAIESWAAFFLESVFIGIWLHGWNKLSRGLHVFCLWMVALGAALSAFWILTANAFMQEPVGYVVRNGRVELTDFAAVAFGPQVQLFFWHAFFACLLTSSFFVIGVSAYLFLRKTPEGEFLRRSLKIAAVLGLFSAVGVIFVGHLLGGRVAGYQPMKLAAAEAIWETRTDGKESLFAIPDEKARRNKVDIGVPGLLNLLVYDRLTGTIRGMNDIQKEYEAQYGPGNYIPMVTLTYWSFRLMIFSGFAMFLLLIFLLKHTAKGRLDFHPLFLKGLVLSIALPHLANIAGWIVTEVGRQPWVVQGLMLTRDGVSRGLDSGTALTSLVVFALVYSLLFLVALSLGLRIVNRGPDAETRTR